MSETLTRTKWPALRNNQKVGVITNYLSEQLLRRDFTVRKITPENCEEQITDYNLEVVFIDNTIYEEDHEWIDYNTNEILEHISILDVNIVLVNYNESYLHILDESIFQININPDKEIIDWNENILEIPLLINEKLFNPVNDKPKTDIVYFMYGELKEEEEAPHNLFHGKPQIISEEIETTTITRSMLKKLFEKVKKAKVLYIYYSEEIDSVFLKYLETIATLQNTIVVMDSRFEQVSWYAYNTHEQDSNINYLQAFTKDGLFYDKAIISKNRDAFLNHTLIQFPSLPEVLKGAIDRKNINIGIITSTKRKWTIEDYVHRLNQQNHVNIQSVLLTHGFELSMQEKENIESIANFDMKIINRDETISFGRCLNACVDLIDFEYFTKIDDDDFYYPNYLIDAWITKQFSEADIVGKYSQFVYLEGDNLTIQRFMAHKNRYSKYVAGATIFCETDFLKRFMFSDLPRAVDSDLIGRVLENGGQIYCGHPYEFCIFRADDKTEHTWQIPDAHLLKSAKIHFYDDPSESLTMH